jgi:hypothetical protein
LFLDQPFSGVHQTKMSHWHASLCNKPHDILIDRYKRCISSKFQGDLIL